MTISGSGGWSLGKGQRCVSNWALILKNSEFAFENSIDNGGEVVKLAFIREQSNKISQKIRFRDETQADDSVRRVIENDIGDPWLVDFCIT